MFRPQFQRVLAAIATLLATSALVLLFVAHSAGPHARCPFVPGQCQTGTNTVDRHADALRSLTTATVDRGVPLVAIAALLPFALTVLVVPRALAVRPALASEGSAERLLEWLVLLERRDPLAPRGAA